MHGYPDHSGSSYSNALRVEVYRQLPRLHLPQWCWQVKNYDDDLPLVQVGHSLPLMGISYVTGASPVQTPVDPRHRCRHRRKPGRATEHAGVSEPGTGRSTLSLELTEASDVMVRVLDLQGREVIAIPMERYLPGKLRLPLDVANLASGNYLLQAIINDRNARSVSTNSDHFPAQKKTPKATAFGVSLFCDGTFIVVPSPACRRRKVMGRCPLCNRSFARRR